MNVKVLGGVHWPAKRLGSRSKGKGVLGRVSENRPHLRDLRILCQLITSALIPFRFPLSPELSCY